MRNIIDRLDDYEGFQPIKENSKLGLKMYMLKEEG